MPARRVTEGALLAVVLLLAASAPASAAVTVGSNLSDPQNSETCFTQCTAVQQSLRPASIAPSGLTSPTNGVVVRWRVKLGNFNACVSAATGRLRVIRGNLGITGGPIESLLLPAGTHTFPARLPVSVGDRIGIDGSVTCSSPPPGSGLPLVYYDMNPGSGVVDYWSPPLADAEVRAPAQLGGVNSFELLVNADIEADADHDGYGDDRQRMPDPRLDPGRLPRPAAGFGQDRTGRACDVRLQTQVALGAQGGLRGKVSSNEAAEITGTADIARRLARRLGQVRPGSGGCPRKGLARRRGRRQAASRVHEEGSANSGMRES